MNGNTAFVISQAVQLIAADGQYKHSTLEEAVEAVMAEMLCLDHHFDPDAGDMEGTLQ